MQQFTEKTNLLQLFCTINAINIVTVVNITLFQELIKYPPNLEEYTQKCTVLKNNEEKYTFFHTLLTIMQKNHCN